MARSQACQRRQERPARQRATPGNERAGVARRGCGGRGSEGCTRIVEQWTLCDRAIRETDRARQQGGGGHDTLGSPDAAPTESPVCLAAHCAIRDKYASEGCHDRRSGMGAGRSVGRRARIRQGWRGTLVRSCRSFLSLRADLAASPVRMLARSLAPGRSRAGALLLRCHISGVLLRPAMRGGRVFPCGTLAPPPPCFPGRATSFPRSFR